MKKSGFTLIELSIVLVIIGLIVGGVLVGQDLIRAAQIRSQIKQIDAFNVAANTFRLKYNYLPGDIPFKDAYANGLFTCDGQFAGDGDGYLYQFQGGAASSPNGVIPGATPSRETNLFWRHLSDAHMIAGEYGTMGDATMSDPTPDGVSAECGLASVELVGAANVGLMLPPAMLVGTAPSSVSTNAQTGSLFISVGHKGLFGPPNRNAFNICYPLTMGGPSNSLQVAEGKGMSVYSAYAIDSKADDGKPFTGNIRQSQMNRVGVGRYCVTDPVAGPADQNYLLNDSRATGYDCGLGFALQ